MHTPNIRRRITHVHKPHFHLPYFHSDPERHAKPIKGIHWGAAMRMAGGLGHKMKVRGCATAVGRSARAAATQPASARPPLIPATPPTPHPHPRLSAHQVQEDSLRSVRKQAFAEDCDHCATDDPHKRSALKNGADGHAPLDGNVHVNQVTFEPAVKAASSTAGTHMDMDSSVHSIHSTGSHGGHGHDHVIPNARKKLKRRDLLTGVFILACGLFSIFLFLGYSPHERRTDVHTTQLRAFALPITSPLYAVSQDYPLVFGGYPHGALAPTNARSCIDILLIGSCLGTDTQCLQEGEEGHRRLHAISGENGLPIFGHNRRLSEDQVRATLVWGFWAGGTGPGTIGSRQFLNDTIQLRLYEETEYLQTCIDPSSYGIPSDEPLFFRMSTDREAPVGMMLQLIEMGPIGQARVILAGVLFLLTFGLILSEIINRVYAALCGVCLGLGLHMLVYEKPELQYVMQHVDWGTLILLFAMMINVRPPAHAPRAVLLEPKCLPNDSTP
jgi:hypothetical protein